MKKILFWLLLLLIVCVPVVLPLTKPGFFPTHDGEWAIVRLAEMHREIKDMQFPPRWADFLNHGYGYPLFLFTYPLPYYIGEIFHILGFGLVGSIKLIFILSVLLSGLFMFLLGRELAGEMSGFIAAAFYIFAPFRLVDIYVRGSIGELVSFVIFPLLFWSTIKLITNPNLLRLVATSFIFALLITAHNIMALIFTPLWLVFILVAIKYFFEDVTKYALKWFLPTILLGLGLSAFFWLPALGEKNFILLSKLPLADISQNFINPPEFLNSPWNYGLRPSFQLGWVHILIFIVGVSVLLLSKGVERKKNLFLGTYILLSFLFLIFLTNSLSLPLWRLPLLSQIDFPWRLLSPIVFFMALGTMFVTNYKIVRNFALVFIFLSLFLIPNFAKPQAFFQKNDEYYQDNDATTTSMDELMPIWLVNKPTNRYANKVDVLEGRADIGNLTYNSKMINFSVAAVIPSIVKINTIYFPGWKFFVDKKEVVPSYNDPQGLSLISVPSGFHEVSGQLLKTPVRTLADTLSLISILGVFLCILISFFPRLKRKFI